MLLLYLVVIATVTSLGLLLIIRSVFLPNRIGIWGYIFFAVAYLIHDLLLMLFSETVWSSVPISLKFIEFIGYYLISFFIIKYCLQGDGVKNFIWIYGIDFVYQAMASIILPLLLAFAHTFTYKEIELVSDRPSLANVIWLMASCMFGVALTKQLIIVLVRRNNRIIQAVITVMAATDIFAVAINSVKSLYIVFPLIVIILVWGLLYQDNMLKQAEIQQKYYRQLEERQKIREEELAKIRHDLSNHIGIINSAGGKNYANEVLKAIDREFRSGNPIVDSLLDEKERICKEKDIYIKERLIDISGSIINNFDWVSLLANLLDNSIEACERTGENKQIDLELYQNGVYLVLTLANSKSSEEQPIDNRFATTKQKKQNHGFGTRIVKDIVSKYEGRIRYEDQGNKMITHLTIQAW